MTRVFLVDDEIIMRDSLRTLFSRLGDAYQLVGEAPDGEIAFPMVLETHPDILMTDICMPFVDGLELAERVRKEMPDIKIMMISGYDDSTYLERANAIGVQAYIRKPITREMLLRVLDRMVQGLPAEDV